MIRRIDPVRARSSFTAVAAALREMQAAVAANRAGIAGVVFLCLIAYGFLAFNLTLAGDDWRMVHDNKDHYALFLNVGRWAAVGLWQIFYENRFAPAATLFAALTLMTVGAVVCARGRRAERFGRLLLCGATGSQPCPRRNLQLQDQSPRDRLRCPVGSGERRALARGSARRQAAPSRHS